MMHTVIERYFSLFLQWFKDFFHRDNPFNITIYDGYALVTGTKGSQERVVIQNALLPCIYTTLVFKAPKLFAHIKAWFVAMMLWKTGHWLLFFKAYF